VQCIWRGCECNVCIILTYKEKRPIALGACVHVTNTNWLCLREVQVLFSILSVVSDLQCQCVLW